MKKTLITVCAATFLISSSHSLAGQHKICSESAKGMHRACRAELKDDNAEAKVICANILDAADADECYAETTEGLGEARGLCTLQFYARNDLCDELGEAAYDISEFWQAENFVDPDEIGESITPNPWFDLSVGTTNTFYGGGETITVVVTVESKLIEGVRCRTVNDLVTEDGLNLEDTDDWYAQDIAGNVWYCGEISLNYELFDGDDPEEVELVEIEGSWKAFRDGAQPGILVHAFPEVGTTYRQEISWGDAEDVAMVLTTSGDGLLDGDECESEEITEALAEHLDTMCQSDCLITLEYSALEPDLSEHKYYAPGVGLLAETEDGECVATQGVISEEGDIEDELDEDDEED